MRQISSISTNVVDQNVPDKHSIAALRYRLVEGPVDLKPLRIVASREINWIEWTVRFVILGASHAVTLSRGGDSITELLTCAPPFGPIRSIVEGKTDNS